MFVELKRVLAGSLDLSARLPNWPFRAESGYVTIYEYDRVLGSSFGAVLQALADAHGDVTVAAIGLSPEPAYYRREYGFFPGFETAGASVGVDYGVGVRWEPGGDPTGSLGDTLDVIAIAGASGAWSVFAQRDWELGLLLTPNPVGAWLHSGVPWFGRDIDLDSIRSPSGWGASLSQIDLATFWRHVRERGSGR
jgi:hypothetical protein